jgi:tropomyosin
LKSAKEETDKAVSQNDQYRRKIEMLEAELDAADKNLKETTEKLRQVDIRAEHFERQVAILEQDKDKLEKKYEESEAKYRKSKADLDALVLEMESI